MAELILTIPKTPSIDKNNQTHILSLVGRPTPQLIQTTISTYVKDKNIADRLINAIQVRLDGNRNEITKNEITTIVHNINIDIQQQARFNEMDTYIKQNKPRHTIYDNGNTLMHMLYKKKDMFSEKQLETLTELLYKDDFYKENLNDEGKTVLDLAPEELKQSLISEDFKTYKQLFIRNIKQGTLDKHITKFASMELWFKGVSTDNPPPIYSVLYSVISVRSRMSFSDIVWHVVLPYSRRCSTNELAIQLVKSDLLKYYSEDNKEALQRIGLMLQRIKVCLHTMGLFRNDTNNESSRREFVSYMESRRREFVLYMDDIAQHVKNIFEKSHDVF